MAYLAAPFKTSGEFPIEERLVFKTKADMIKFGKDKYSCMPDSYFAVCTEDSNFYIYSKKDHASTSGGWKQVEGKATSADKLDNDILVSTAWGSISAGTVIPAGTDFSDIFTSALSPYAAPTISLSTAKSMYVYPSAGAATATIANLKMDLKCGTKNVSKIAFINESNTSAVSCSGLNKTFSFTSAINYNITGDTNLNAWAYDGAMHSKSLAIKFALPYYYGVSTTNEIAAVTDGTYKAPTKTTAESQTITFSCGGGDGKYIWFAYNNDFANLKSIMQGATNITEQFTTTTASYNDRTMKLYVSKLPIIDDNTLTFNF